MLQLNLMINISRNSRKPVIVKIVSESNVTPTIGKLFSYKKLMVELTRPIKKNMVSIKERFLLFACCKSCYIVGKWYFLFPITDEGFVICLTNKSDDKLN